MGHDCDDDFHLETDQLGGKVGKPLKTAIGRSILYGDLLSVCVTKPAQFLAEDIFARRLRDGGEKSDPWYLPRLLPFARERGREEAESNGANEGAAVHYSIT